MKKVEKKKLDKVIVLSAIIIITTLFIGALFIYMPFLNRTKSLRAEILHERDKNILIGKIRAIGKHLKVYTERIPEHKDVSWLLGIVSDMVSKEEIELSSIKPDSPEDRGLYIRLSVIVDTVSTYHGLGKFISRIESSEKFLRVENINIERLDVDKELDKGIEEYLSRFKPFDIKAHIVISTVLLKE